MKTIKIEEIRNYLGTDLMCYVENSMQEKELKLISCFLNNWEVETVLAFQSGNDYGFSDAEYKPIVRPLSQLTQEIEHNGEKFVPIIEIIKEKYSYSKLIEITEFKLGLKNSCKFRVQRNGELLEKWYIYVVDLKDFRVRNTLYKLHFDMFEWIEKGLAIEKK